MTDNIGADIMAGVRFLSRTEGGRSIATSPDHFGCLFYYQGENYDCRLLLDGIGPMRPGDRQIVPIKFLSPHLLLGRFSVGEQFNLKEGGQTIAEGVVERIYI